MCENINNIHIEKNNKCKYIENDIDVIVPGLYLGNFDSSNDFGILEKYKIKYIIRATLQKGTIFPQIHYLHVPIKDHMIDTINTDHLFTYTGLYIQKNIFKGNILVHCKKGHHRSACIIAAFLFKNLNLPYEIILQYINSIRNCALRRDTLMMRGLYKYYLKINNIKYNNIYYCPTNNKYVIYKFN